MDSYNIDEFEMRIPEDEDALEVWDLNSSPESLEHAYAIGPQDEAVKIWKDEDTFCIATATMPTPYDTWNRNEYLFLQDGGGILAVDIRDAAKAYPPVLTYNLNNEGSYIIVQIDDQNRINIHFNEGN